jgi:superfamily II DNA or RNA helicase
MQIDDLLKKLPSDNFGKGDAFEKLVKWWLQNDSVWKGLLKPNTVKLWNESPHRQGRDIGIDLTAEDYLGHVWAIQAKNWREDTSLPKSEIDKFLSASNTRKFQKRLLVTTTSSISSNALSAMDHQEKEAKKVTIHDLRESNVEWQLYFDNPKANATKAVKIPFPHQKDAIKNTVKGLKENKRGQLIMACGSGKTITAQRIDEELQSKLTLVLVPSLLLVQQTLKSWREETRKDFLSMAVCSDDTVTNDSAVGKVSDLSIPVTTDSKEIKEFLKLKGRKVIFSTYQSSSKIAKAIKGTKRKFDLVIADEAHRLAGTVDKEYGSVLQKNALPSKHYLFMTATPRIFTANVQKTASERGVEVYSMDDESIFGKQLHNYSFADAIRDGVLTDYRVVVVGVDDPMLVDMIEQRELVRAGDIDTDAKTLASHIGLAKAMRDYKLNRVISFHSRIKSAKNFAEAHPRIRDWMKEPNIKSTKLTTLTISGQDSSDARKTVLDQLKEVDIDSQGLVTNARCLTEGVDVPTLDGIAFIDPRASQVDIVQAVGRAIRRGGDEKKFGYIVIPIFFSQEEIDEEIINESVFKPIWNVINALKSHDTKLADEIDELRISLGRSRKPMGVSEKVIFDLPLIINSSFVDKIHTSIIEKTSSNWMFSYGALSEYVSEFDKYPIATEEYKGIKIGAWLALQRSRVDYLEKERKELLNRLPNFIWEPYEHQWETGFMRLENFVERYGHARPVRSFVDEDGFKLAVWVGVQRSQYKKGKLGKDKIDRLTNLSPSWSFDPFEDDWEFGFKKLEKFTKENGNANPPAKYQTEDGFNLGRWVSVQRQVYRKVRFKSELTPLKIKRLESLVGWEWNPRKSRFEIGLNELHNYIDKFGNSKINSKYISDSGYTLGLWISIQRSRKNTLTKQQIAELEKIMDWTWDPLGDDWIRNYKEVLNYCKEFGRHPSYGYVDSEGRNTGKWLYAMKNRPPQDPEKLELLSAIPGWGESKDQNTYEFLEMFEELKKYYFKNNDLDVDRNFLTETGKNLLGWINRQKSNYRRAELSEDRIELLNSIPAWNWERIKQWEFDEVFDILEKYSKIHGTSDISIYVKFENVSIGKWVSRQRSKYNSKALSEDRILKLEKLPNWTWKKR